jgi:hypothetical protein
MKNKSEDALVYAAGEHHVSISWITDRQLLELQKAF